MEDTQLDSFLEFVTLVEEGAEQFSTSQVKKLELIRTKVNALVTRASQVPQQQSSQVMIPKQVQEIRKGVNEVRLHSFNEFIKLDEMIKKKGSGFVVTDKTGKKVLGKHSSRKKAVKQLQALEISKAKGE